MHGLSDSLVELLESRKAKLSLREILDRVAGRDGLGPVLFVLTLPILLPLPPGASMVLALPLLFVAPQIMVERKHLWLPAWLGARTIDRRAFAKLAKRVQPWLKPVEALGRPRLAVLTGAAGARAIGLAATLIALLLVLPIPFANLLPALALGFLALGLTRKDGLMVLAGYTLLAAALGVIVLGAHGILVILRQIAHAV